jgi:hypothetical protein
MIVKPKEAVGKCEDVKRRNARYKSGYEEIEQKQLAMLSAQTRHSSGPFV